MAPCFPTVHHCVKFGRKIHSSLHNSQQRARRAPGQISKVTLKPNQTVLLCAEEADPPLDWYHHWRKRPLWEKWLFVALDQLGPFGAPGNDTHSSVPVTKQTRIHLFSAIAIFNYPFRDNLNLICPGFSTRQDSIKVDPVSLSVYLYNRNFSGCGICSSCAIFLGS